MRFALVGLGWAARELALPALSALSSVEVLGGCDSSAEQRLSWEQATGLPAFARLDELVQRVSPEAVVIATPPHTHAELCLAALELGLHVVCEKPFVTSLDDAEAVLAAAARVGRQVAVNHEFRCNPIFETLAGEIRAGRHGRLTFCQMWQLMDLAPWNEPSAWRAAMAGQSLLEGGIHLVDLMLTLFGGPPEAVYARHSSGLDRDHEGDAIQLLTLEFADGRLGQITIDRLCPAAGRYLEVRADCERATLRASIGGRASVRFGAKRAERSGIRVDLASGGMAWLERGAARRTLARSPRNPARVGTAKLLADIVTALDQGQEPPSSGEQARVLLAVIEAAYESSRSGRRIPLAEALHAMPEALLRARS